MWEEASARNDWHVMKNTLQKPEDSADWRKEQVRFDLTRYLCFCRDVDRDLESDVPVKTNEW